MPTWSNSVGPTKKPSPSASGFDLPAVHHQLGAVGLAGVDVARHPVPGAGGDQRAHVAAAGAVAGAQRRRSLLDLRDQLVADLADRHHRGDRHAALPRRAVAGVDRLVGGQVEVGVGQHQHVVLRPAERLHPLAVRGAGLVDVPGDRGRADEGDRCDLGVGQQPVDGDLVAVQHVEDAVRQPRLLPQLGDPQRSGRVLLARLQHHRVAGRDGDREEPHRHHGREVERAR